MKYEKISDNCLIRWIENFDFEKQVYTQVSGYIFDNENRLLIVNVNGNWTVPGGHPEINESPIETLNREVYEESMVKIKNIKYIGAVEVIENEKKYYQLRYFANLDSVFEFKSDFESTAREFVEICMLGDYIKWYNETTFVEQIKAAQKHLV